MTKSAYDVFVAVGDDGNYLVGYEEEEVLEEAQVGKEGGWSSMRMVHLKVTMSPPSPTITKSEKPILIPDGATEIDIDADEP